MPIFGLGCVAGAAGIARAADYVRGFPDEVAVLLSVELCSLTLQRQDLSIPNLIASGLFGDGAAAAVVVGAERARRARRRDAGAPEIVATRSIFYPDSERVMGWDISESGFQIVLSADVPQVVDEHLRADVDALPRRARPRRAATSPPGSATRAARRCSRRWSRRSKRRPARSSSPGGASREVGNLSSTSVLLVLASTLAERRPPAGSLGMLLALGPGFCSELVLLRW